MVERVESCHRGRRPGEIGGWDGSGRRGWEEEKAWAAGAGRPGKGWDQGLAPTSSGTWPPTPSSPPASSSARSSVDELVRLLAEAQGGEVRYRDAPAGGAVFSVTMPIAAAA